MPVDPVSPNQSAPTSAEGRPTPHRDLRWLTALLVLLVCIPSILIVGALGAAGTPADLLGVYMLIAWAFRRIARPSRRAPLNPVRLVMFAYVATIMTSYLMAATRPIGAVELSAADRGVLSTLAWLGMLMFALDAARTLGQLDTIVRRLVLAGAAEAAVGLTQFVTKLSLVNYIEIPGLRPNSDLEATLASRGSLARPAGTTIHPIEFGAVLTLVLPLALHYAVNDVEYGRWRRFLPLALIAFAIPISISRSAMVSALIGLVFVLPSWSRSLRRRAYAALALLGGCVYLLVPGLLGTLQGLFTGISTDSSAASRTDSYAIVEEFFRRSPILGRGFGTFLPKYRILDNQFLGTTIETGIIGVIALLALIVVPIVACVGARRRIGDPRQRELAVALAGSVAASGVSFALYDALSFPTAASMFFLVVGLSGAFLRLHADDCRLLR